jgi:hypothetical protein
MLPTVRSLGLIATHYVSQYAALNKEEIMNRPKDYGDRSGLLKEAEPDNEPNIVAVACWVSMTMLGAFFIPVTTFVVLLILKLVEVCNEESSRNSG